MSRITVDDVCACLEDDVYKVINLVGSDMEMYRKLSDLEWYCTYNHEVDDEDWEIFEDDVMWTVRDLRKNGNQDGQDFFYILEISSGNIEVVDELTEKELIAEYEEETIAWLGLPSQEIFDALDMDTVIKYITEEYGYGYLVELGRDNPLDIVADLSGSYPAMLNVDWCSLGASLRKYEEEAKKSEGTLYLTLTNKDPKLATKVLFTEQELKDNFGDETLEWLDKNNR